MMGNSAKTERNVAALGRRDYGKRKRQSFMCVCVGGGGGLNRTLRAKDISKIKKGRALTDIPLPASSDPSPAPGSNKWSTESNTHHINAR